MVSIIKVPGMRFQQKGVPAAQPDPQEEQTLNINDCEPAETHNPPLSPLEGGLRGSIGQVWQCTGFTVGNPPEEDVPDAETDYDYFPEAEDQPDTIEVDVDGDGEADLEVTDEADIPEDGVIVEDGDTPDVDEDGEADVDEDGDTIPDGEDGDVEEDGETLDPCANAPVVSPTVVPADDALDIPLTPILDWDASDIDAGDALTYRVRIWRTAEPATMLVDEALSDSQYPVPAGLLVNSENYSWQIDAWDTCSPTPLLTSSPVWHFTTRDITCEGAGGTVRVSTDVNMSEVPSLAWDGANYLVSWQDNRDGMYGVFVRQISAAGVPLGGETRLTGATYSAIQPSLVWTGAEYGLCWEDSRHGESEIYFRRLSSAGTPLDADVRVTNSAGYSALPSSAWGGSEYMIAWTDGRTGDPEIYVRRISGTGVILGETRVTSNPSRSSAPSLVSTGSGYAVAFEDNRDGNNEIYFRLLSSTGVPQGTDDIRISDSAGESLAPSLVWNGAEFGVFWMDNRDGNYEIYFRRIASDGTPLGSEMLVTTLDGQVSRSSSASWNGTEYVLSWQDDSEGNAEVYYQRISTSGVPIGSAVNVSNEATGTSVNPAVVPAGTDEYGVVWQDNRDLNDEIYYGHVTCVR